MRFVERVEGVEELFLGRLLARHELDVVYEQQVHLPELVPELLHLLVAEAVDHLVHELFGGVVADLRLAVLGEDLVPDGVHQVGLAKTDAAVDEERVVVGGGLVGDRLRRRVGELVARAADKGFKGVLGVQVREEIGLLILFLIFILLFLLGSLYFLYGSGLGGSLRLRLADMELEVIALAVDRGDGLLDHLEVFVGDPFLKEGTGNFEDYRIVGGAQELQRNDPRIVCLLG